MPMFFSRSPKVEMQARFDLAKERRKHIASNSRLLVGKQYENIPNLASKVLSLAADRISQDWMRRYRASQFSRYLLERTRIPARDRNARLNIDKLIKYSRFRAFLAPF